MAARLRWASHWRFRLSNNFTGARMAKRATRVPATLCIGGGQGVALTIERD